MTYQEHYAALIALKAKLEQDAQFKVSYTNVYAAIANKVQALAAKEQA